MGYEGQRLLMTASQVWELGLLAYWFINYRCRVVDVVLESGYEVARGVPIFDLFILRGGPNRTTVGSGHKLVQILQSI